MSDDIFDRPKIKLERSRKLTFKNLILSHVCDITRDLDKIAGIDKSCDDLYCHYITYDIFDKHSKDIKLGRKIIGCIKHNDDNIISEIEIYNDDVTYPKDINENINHKYIGGKLILL